MNRQLRALKSQFKLPISWYGKNIGYRLVAYTRSKLFTILLNVAQLVVLLNLPPVRCCDNGGHDPAWQRWLLFCVLRSVMIPNMSSPVCVCVACVRACVRVCMCALYFVYVNVIHSILVYSICAVASGKCCIALAYSRLGSCTISLFLSLALTHSTAGYE